MAERILMIDDDDRLAGMVSDYLGGAGFRLTIAGTARDGEALLKRESFDAVILDLMLPDADGLDLCRRLRATTDVPIRVIEADPFYYSSARFGYPPFHRRGYWGGCGRPGSPSTSSPDAAHHQAVTSTAVLRRERPRPHAGRKVNTASSGGQNRRARTRIVPMPRET